MSNVTPSLLRLKGKTACLLPVGDTELCNIPLLIHGLLSCVLFAFSRLNKPTHFQLIPIYYVF